MDNSTVSVVHSPMDLVTVTRGFEDLYRVEYPGLVAVARAITGDLYRSSRDAAAMFDAWMATIELTPETAAP
jgi:hypothetical protein